MMYQKVLTAVVLAVCTWTDMRRKKIYGSVILLYLTFVLAGYLAEYICGKQIAVLEIAGGLIPGVVCLIFAFLTRQGIGYGDGMLILIMGLSVGREICVATAVTAFFWAGIWGFVMWRFLHADRKKEIPFMPFLLLGFVIQNVGKLWGA